MNKYDLILFDMDGTIADTDLMILKTYYELYDLYNDGKRKSDEEIYTFSGPPLEETLKKEFPHLPLDFIINEYRKISIKYYYDSITEILGVLKVLHILKDKGIKLGIVTNKIREMSLLTLKILKMEDIFSILISIDDIGIGKPNPKGINKAIELSGVNKNKVLYVGDNEVDHISAKNADIDSAILYFGRRKISKDLKPDIKLYCYDDLIKEVIYE